MFIYERNINRKIRSSILIRGGKNRVSIFFNLYIFMLYALIPFVAWLPVWRRNIYRIDTHIWDEYTLYTDKNQSSILIRVASLLKTNNKQCDFFMISYLLKCIKFKFSGQMTAAGKKISSNDNIHKCGQSLHCHKKRFFMTSFKKGKK